MTQDAGEAALLRAAREGDDAACRALVARYEGMVAAVVIGMLGRGDEADDVGQETFVRFFHSLGRFRGEARLGTYLQRIAINLSLNALKRRKRQALRMAPLEVLDLDARAREAPHDPAEAREIEAQVRAALDRLSPLHRPVVVLRMMEGYSTRETAELLGLPEGTVLSRLARASAHLRELLGPALRTEES